MDDLDSLLDVAQPVAAERSPYFGFVEFSAARAYESPSHWSKLRARGVLGMTGRLGDAAKWKISGRLDADMAPAVESDIYPTAVERDLRDEFMVREAYVDFAAGGLDYRVGRQHVVWGEMVGLFFADVVSARDLREFYLPEFDQMRTPQWAVRAEHFGDDWHLEALWIPVPSYDDIGKPGGEFYPFLAPAGARIAHEDKPGNRPGNMNWGLRASRLIDGWDLSAFYYRSTDITQTFYRTSDAPLVFTPRHDRIRQVGATFSKDLGSFVLKGEAVHTHGRKFNTNNPAAPYGLEASDTLDYVVGVDVPIGADWRVNAQYYGRTYYGHNDWMDWDRNEQGWTLLVNHAFTDALEAEVLMVSALNREDYMIRPKVVWQMTPVWRGIAGFDIFGGDTYGVFGRYDDKDRAYLEVRRDF
ncbi:DUF1302 family protein [Nitrogeniibacter mangrovi]|nr:DUF1302 family protein [Nitrogeniibacter mangrovi]